MRSDAGHENRAALQTKTPEASPLRRIVEIIIEYALFSIRRRSTAPGILDLIKMCLRVVMSNLETEET